MPRSAVASSLVRATASAMLSAVLFACVVLPTPPAIWPVFHLLYFPLGLATWLSGIWPYGIPPVHSAPMWRACSECIVVGTAVYTPLSYVTRLFRPSLRMIRALARFTRWALHDRSTFLTYFLCGGVVGAIAGMAIWAQQRFVGSRMWLLVWLFIGATGVGWVLAASRSALPLIRGLFVEKSG